MGLTDRRHFVLATSALLSAALARAQTAGKVHRVTWLGVIPPRTFQHLVTALTEGLRALGYVEGRNLVLEWRHADGKVERFAELASEVVRDKPDLIVTGTNPGTHAAKRATQTIPIVTALRSTRTAAIGSSPPRGSKRRVNSSRNAFRH